MLEKILLDKGCKFKSAHHIFAPLKKQALSH